MTDPHGTHGPSANLPDAHGSSTVVAGPHGEATDHGDDGHGHDDHAHAPEALGQVDWSMWGVGLLGVAAALAVMAGFVVATGFSFGA